MTTTGRWHVLLAQVALVLGLQVHAPLHRELELLLGLLQMSIASV
jgi:hypothetical protein